MEFVHSLKTSERNDTDMYNQNNNTDTNCYFENRLQQPISNLYIPLTNKRDSYSSNYSSPNTITNLSEEVQTIENNIPSHYNILINNVNNLNQPSLIDITQSYDVNEDNVNFNYKDYNNQTYSIDNSNLLSDNKYHTETSVTDNDVYTTNDFWTKQVPNIITNEYIIRDAARYNYDDNFERYTLPKNTSGKYFNKEITNNYSVPKVSNNYNTNYTQEDGKIIHEGKKKQTNNNRYKSNTNYSREDNGMLVYYDDNKDVYFKEQLNITEDKKQILDPNGNKYNKFINVNVKDPSLSEHEKNIMLRRNDTILASMNHTMRYD